MENSEVKNMIAQTLTTNQLYFSSHFTTHKLYVEYLYIMMNNPEFTERIRDSLSILFYNPYRLKDTVLGTESEQFIFLFSMLSSEDKLQATYLLLSFLGYESEDVKIKSSCLLLKIFASNIVTHEQIMRFLINKNESTILNILLYNFLPNNDVVRGVMNEYRDKYSNDGMVKMMEEYLNYSIVG